MTPKNALLCQMKLQFRAETVFSSLSATELSCVAFSTSGSFLSCSTGASDNHSVICSSRASLRLGTVLPGLETYLAEGGDVYTLGERKKEGWSDL